jgi:hypothetical protein
MTVIDTYTSRVNPGRLHDAVALANEAAKLVERHGGSNPRLLAATAAGEQIGVHVFSHEYASFEAYGTGADELARDAEVEALVDRVSRTDSPVTPISQQLCMEIPLDRRGRPGRGSIVEVYLSRTLPGRFDANLDLAQRFFDFIEEQGAVNARLIRLVHAGAQSELTVACWEFENLRAYGAAADAMYRSEDGQAFMREVSQEDPPSVVVSSALYTEIPL